VNLEIDNASNARIGKSSIEGVGVFADIPFLTGEVILDYRPFFDTFYKIAWKDLTLFQTEHNWMIPINDEYCLTSDPISKIHYFNHSRTPNCIWNIKEGTIKAARYIPFGDELTIDYRIEYRPTRKEFPEWV